MVGSRTRGLDNVKIHGPRLGQAAHPWFPMRPITLRNGVIECASFAVVDDCYPEEDHQRPKVQDVSELEVSKHASEGVPVCRQAIHV